MDQDTHIVIWTTTPWTIPANLGISVHPDLSYTVVEANGKKFMVAEDLLAAVAKEFEWEGYQVVQTVKGTDLENVIAEHPLYGRDSLVMLGEHVTTDAGTGCVHTAPGHGEDDFQVGMKYGLDVLCPVDDKGNMTNEAPGFEGLFYDAANKPITEKLEEAGALLKLTFITHSYPHDWRTKKPVIFRATAQWFASIKDFRNELLEAVKETNWYPAWGETRLLIWSGIAEIGASPASVYGECLFRSFMRKMEKKLSQMRRLNMFQTFSVNTVQTSGSRKKRKNCCLKVLHIQEARMASFQKKRISWMFGLIPVLPTRQFF